MNNYEHNHQLPSFSGEKRELPGLSVEFFSQGKDLLNPYRTEDRVIYTENTFGIVDGATSKAPLTFDGKTGGSFAADIVANTISQSSLNGIDLVTAISENVNQTLHEIGALEQISNFPHSRPTAVFAIARIVNNMLLITAVGDVGLRINGKDVWSAKSTIDKKHAEERKQAMEELSFEHPELSEAELLSRGRDAIVPSLQTQFIHQNNPDPTDQYAYGAVDGTLIPARFITTHMHNLRSSDVIEIYSDGYFKPGTEPTVESWEKAFEEVEKEDPHKMKTYLATKGSLPGKMYTDDRSLIIVKIK